MSAGIRAAEGAHDAAGELLKTMNNGPVGKWCNNVASDDRTTEAWKKAQTALIELRHHIAGDLSVLHAKQRDEAEPWGEP